MSKKKPPVLGPPVAGPTLAPSVAEATRRLDLACGATPKEGFEGVDEWAGPNVAHVVNLMRYPWPFADASVDEIFCSHFVEHIPDTSVWPDGTPAHAGDKNYDRALCKDAWFRFFEEVHRILKPMAIATIICPSARHHRGFQDPTHRRFIVAETFSYLDADWRTAVGLAHYNTWVNFEGAIDWGTTPEFNVLHDSVKAKKLTESWNVIADWMAVLRKKPRRDLPAGVDGGAR